MSLGAFKARSLECHRQDWAVYAVLAGKCKWRLPMLFDERNSVSFLSLHATLPVYGKMFNSSSQRSFGVNWT